ncbi:MAG TPA: hypothetical protein VMZ27_11045, partial [Candidatus Saccharimonadales bacterium]|nr:hypothetical protein [Candidatus Saccharimonadales bacterium]
ALTLNALAFLQNLRRQGTLPGFDKDEPLWMDRGERGELPFAFPPKEKPSGYPATRWFFFYKPNRDDFVYQYIVRKNTLQDNWHLVKAWRSDQGGKGEAEYYQQ